jgi:hypothetical protein
VLEQQIEVAEQHPKFLKKQLGEVVAAMLQVRGGALTPVLGVRTGFATARRKSPAPTR